MIQCQQCGTQNPEGKKFCRECGAQLLQPDDIQDSKKEVPVQEVATNLSPQKKGNRWWIWVIVVLVVAAGAYFFVLKGGMGGLDLSWLKSEKQTENKQTENQETQSTTAMVYGVMQTLANNDSGEFIEEYCLTRSLLHDYNEMIPEEEQFDIKEASKVFGRVEGKLLDGWRDIRDQAQKYGVNWSEASVLSQKEYPFDGADNLLMGLEVIVDWKGNQILLFFEICAQFTDGWRVCKEIEWQDFKSNGEKVQFHEDEKLSQAEPEQNNRGAAKPDNKPKKEEVKVDLGQIDPDEKAERRGQDEVYSNPNTTSLQGDTYVAMTSPSGSSFMYKGEMKNNMANGLGRAEYNNGLVYEGQFKDNLKSGEGTLYYTDGAKYIGSFLSDIRQGKGSIYWPDSSFYTGDWRNDKRNGFGVHTWSSGNKYIGDYKDDKRHGKGTFQWADGQRYVGDFVNDVRTGQGTYNWPDGNEFTGRFENNQMISGSFNWANGNRYEGPFVNGLHEGKGTYKWADGTIYVGDFKAGVKEGVGEIKWTNGTKYKGDWKNDQRNGQGTYWWSDGSYRVGGVANNAFHGYGTEYNKEGVIRAQGTWVNGVFQK